MKTGWAVTITREKRFPETCYTYLGKQGRNTDQRELRGGADGEQEEKPQCLFVVLLVQGKAASLTPFLLGTPGSTSVN